MKLRTSVRSAGTLAALGLGVVAVLTALPALAGAQDSPIASKLRSGPEVVVPAGVTVPHDLYVSGGTIRMQGRVDGDLVAAGGQIDVPGAVTGDVIAAGGSVTVSGQVGGDLRVASGQARVEGPVAEDVLIGAGQATIGTGAQIGEDLVFGTGEMTMDGAVSGDVYGSTGPYTKRGTVGGTEQVSVSQQEERRSPSLLSQFLDGLGLYVSILLVGALLLRFLPQLLDGAVAAVRRRALASLGFGLLVLIGVPIALIVLIALTIIVAILLGLIGLDRLAGATVFGGFVLAAAVAFLLFVAASFVAQAVIGLFLGRLVFPEPEAPYARRLAALAVGLLVVVLISFVPYVGGWVGFLFVALGVGALVLAARPARPRPAEAPVSEML